jgi:ABC-type lipoprotein export system ATPase subunit
LRRPQGQLKEGDMAIARALANNPKIILADEPTASLNTDRALSVMHLLRQPSSEHNTAVLGQARSPVDRGA